MSLTRTLNFLMRNTSVTGLRLTFHISVQYCSARTFYLSGPKHFIFPYFYACFFSTYLRTSIWHFCNETFQRSTHLDRTLDKSSASKDFWVFSFHFDPNHEDICMKLGKRTFKSTFVHTEPGDHLLNKKTFTPGSLLGNYLITKE